MKHIKLYEESITLRKKRIHNVLHKFVHMLGGDINIKDGAILKGFNKYNKVDRIFIGDDNKLIVVVSTISDNGRKMANLAYHFLSYSEMLKVIEYLKETYPSEYSVLDIYDDIKKYNV